MAAAVASGNLVGRAEANKRFGMADFDGWLKGIVDGLAFSTALDLCCGTGNQLVLYAARPGVRRLVGADLSRESLDAARDRVNATGFGGELVLEAVAMEEAFTRPTVAAYRFDLVSCCYGLYYSTDVFRTLDDILAHLSPGGALFVVGPYGANNARFFDLLQRHFTLPELVLRSATSFMGKEVAPYLKALAEVTKYTFVNPVAFSDPEAVMAYWRKTTFFDDRHEAGVRRDLEAHFTESDTFVIEKHVMAYIARV